MEARKYHCIWWAKHPNRTPSVILEDLRHDGVVVHSHSDICTLYSWGNDFSSPPGGHISPNYLLVTGDIGELVKYWKAESVKAMLGGKIPGPVFYEVEEYLAKNALLDNEPKVS